MEFDHREIQELVISLELSRESRQIAEKLIRKWLLEHPDAEEMEKYIGEVLD